MEKEVVMIGVGSRPEGDPMGEELGMAEEADDQMFAAMAPRGDFTSRGLGPLVRGTNALLPLFGQSADYPEVEDTEVLPTDFVRILAMFQQAVEEAIEEDAIRDEMRIDLDDVRDDTALMTIAGKLEMLAKDKEFKRFLQEEVDGEEEGEMDREPEMETMSPEEEDAMMMSRM
tara:strand:+ start:111 stop:629 length:519 start_codon:yes stop_codon:yes gene_type:complete